MWDTKKKKIVDEIDLFFWSLFLWFSSQKPRGGTVSVKDCIEVPLTTGSSPQTATMWCKVRRHNVRSCERFCSPQILVLELQGALHPCIHRAYPGWRSCSADPPSSWNTRGSVLRHTPIFTNGGTHKHRYLKYIYITFLLFPKKKTLFFDSKILTKNVILQISNFISVLKVN